ncbi:MAG: SRPBCC family protein [Hyphomicrobiaceae bacterium]|nr:SRPBCC family protein [Hyphomicrobiaceae bacterium]
MVRAVAFWCAVLTALAVAMPASAHGPTRKKYAETIEINAPADKVWATIGNFADWSWHPAVEKTEATGNAVDATRVLTLKGGGIIKEKLTKRDDAKRTLSYEITDVDVKVLPVNQYSSIITVTEDGGKSKVEWKAAYYRGFMQNDPPPELNEEAAQKAVSGVYKSGLEALKTKLESGG